MRSLICTVTVALLMVVAAVSADMQPPPYGQNQGGGGGVGGGHPNAHNPQSMHQLRQQQRAQQAQQDADPLGLAPVTELLSVSGCPTNSVPKRGTTECDSGAATRLTIRGRNFPKGGISRVTLVRSLPTGSAQPKKNQDGETDTKGEAKMEGPASMECAPVTHSKSLPTLLIYCDAPKLSSEVLDDVYHLRVTAYSEERAQHMILRNAFRYRSSDLMGGGKGGKPKDGGMNLKSTNWTANYEELGVGGLQVQLDELFRRAFSSRLAANSGIATKIGIRHIKGVILHGPPGTGKTLIARKVGDLLNAKSVQVVSGPEIMSKFVGESEKNLRGLFAAAETDAEKEKMPGGKPGGLHVIIMDEIDAIMRPRGAGDDSGARAVYDGVTTQMLAYMDGFKSSNNLLIIGLTNRLNSMDKALLRPGRFEVQIRIPLPDEKGRLEIFKIHTKQLRENDYLDSSVNLPMISSRAAALSGADISGIVRSAVSYSFERHQKATATYEETKPEQVGGGEEGEEDDGAPQFSVTMQDFAKGIKEVISAKGSSVNTAPFLERGVLVHSTDFEKKLKRLTGLADQMRDSAALRRLRVVIEGPSGAGLTAVAALVARNSRFASVNVITPESLVGLNTGQRVERLTTIFEEAANVAHACIVIDKVESIVEYNAHHNKLNSVLAQELSVLLDRNLALLPYQQESRLMVIMTTSHGSDILRHLNPGSNAGAPGSASSSSASGSFDAHEAFSLLDTASMAELFNAYEVFGSAQKSGLGSGETATLISEAISSHLPNAMGVKQLLFLIDAARSRYGVVSTKCAKVPAKYDAVADTEPSEILPHTSEDDDSTSNDDKTTIPSPPSSMKAGDVGTTAAAADAEEQAVPRYLTVKQFGTVVAEFGVQGGSVIAPESSLGFDATSLDL